VVNGCGRGGGATPCADTIADGVGTGTIGITDSRWSRLLVGSSALHFHHDPSGRHPHGVQRQMGWLASSTNGQFLVGELSPTKEAKNAHNSCLGEGGRRDGASNPLIENIPAVYNNTCMCYPLYNILLNKILLLGKWVWFP
jgi:hypothetical protein